MPRYMQLEALWILTNLSYGNSNEAFFSPNYQFMTHFNKILDGNDFQMIDQLILLLGNLAADSYE